MDNIIPAFSSVIATDTIWENTNVLKKEKNFAYNNLQNNSGKNFKILEKYPKVKNILLNKFKKFSKEKLNYTENFAISTSWITILEKGDQSQQHCHKNSFYSGVYYFDEYEQGEGGKLEFQTPLINFPDFYLIPEKWNSLNTRVIEITPVKNLLVLFPSYLLHRVLPYHGTSLRKSLAFNIIPIGDHGENDSFSNNQLFTKYF